MSSLQDSVIFDSLISDEVIPDSLGVELYQHTLSSANDNEINRKFGKGRSPGRPRKPTTQELEAKVPSLFQDKNMTHAMKESLAISIMKGTHELSPDNNNNTWTGGVTDISNRYDDRNYYTYNPKLRYNEPSFISVESSSAVIPQLSPKKVIQRHKHKKIHDDGRSKLYTWAGKVVSQVKPGYDPLPKHRPATVHANILKINRTKSLANASKMYKDLDKRRSVETVRQIKDIAIEEKRKKNVKSKEVEIRKRYNEFRKRLKMTLHETRNPQTAEILRCIDESMIHHFVSKYKGMAVTVDAIVSFLVKSVGSSGAVAPIDGRDIHPSMRHRLGWVPTTGVYSNSRLTNVLASATPNFEVAPWEYIGAKLNENPDPNATYYLDDEDVNILNRGLSKFPNWGVRVGTANSKLISKAQEVLSPPPSQDGLRDVTKKNSNKSPWGAPKSSPYVTIASGFRAKTADAEEGKAQNNNGLDDSYILFKTTIGDDSLTTTHLNDPNMRNSMSVSQSAFLSKLPNNYYDEMTSPKQFPPGDPTDPFTPKVGANDTEEDTDPEVAAKIAIDTVQNQMIEEGTLPSIQPIRVISNSHVTHIGEGVETFDTVAEKMDLAVKYGMKPTDDEDEGGAIGSHISSISNNAGPKAIKTKQGLEYPRMPYKLGDEVGHIMTYGIAAGAGYSIIKSDSKVGNSNHSSTRGLLRRGNSASTTKKK